MSAVEFETGVEGGIERVVCRPAARTHETPILLLHGMWHAAWCWRDWQGKLAEAGWESCAVSLPGHGGSPRRKSVRFSTLDDNAATLGRIGTWLSSKGL